MAMLTPLCMKTNNTNVMRISCDTILSMRLALPRLRDKLGSEPSYFQRVYNHTFDFARVEGQRGLGLSLAAFLFSRYVQAVY
jgi:hypothetical protein